MSHRVGRRSVVATLGLGALGALVGCASSRAADARCRVPTPGLFPDQDDSPQEILEKLLAGNTRYVNEEPVSHLICAETALERAEGQAPPAMVLSCADSRVAPEMLFDQPRSRLFVCRVAGNVYTDEIAGSLEYGVKVLGSRLLVVLGHSRCGAVGAAVSLVQGTASYPPAAFGRIGLVAQRIAPAVRNAIATSTPDMLILNATNENARLAAAGLSALEPILAAHVRQGTLAVRAARYDIESSRVAIL